MKVKASFLFISFRVTRKATTSAFLELYREIVTSHRQVAATKVNSSKQREWSIQVELYRAFFCMEEEEEEEEVCWNNKESFILNSLFPQSPTKTLSKLFLQPFFNVRVKSLKLSRINLSLREDLDEIKSCFRNRI